MADVTQFPATFLFTSDTDVPFNLQLGSRHATLTVLLSYCALGQPIEPVTLPIQTSIMLINVDGSTVDAVSVSGELSKVSATGVCFTAHARIESLTGSHSVAAIAVQFAGQPCQNIIGSKVDCSQTIQRRNYFPRRPFQGVVQLAVEEHGVLSAASGNALATSLVTTTDSLAPEWSGCPSVIRASAGPGMTTVDVSWVVPTVTDNVRLQSVDDEVATQGGANVHHTLETRVPVYPWVYTAVDSSGLSSSCR